MNISKPLVVSIISLLLLSCHKSPLKMPLSAAQEESAEASDSLYIGKLYQGGKIFWIDSTGKHGLISSIDDPQEAAWLDSRKPLHPITTGATGKSIGTGARNTRRIINRIGPGGNYAARKCLRYESDGYDDWYLPSIGELQEMQSQKDLIGGFLNGQNYWSSTEQNGSVAYAIRVGDTLAAWTKDQLKFVRPIRTF